MSKQTSITGFFTNNNHSKKRKLSNVDSDDENEGNKKRVKRRKIEHEMKDEESTDEDNDNYYFDSNKKQPSCNVIRGKIRAMLAEGDVKVTHWLKQINVNSNSYQRFMKLKGTWNGTGNGTYWGAMRYFKKQKKIKDSMSKNDKIKLKKSKDKKNNENKIIIENMMNKIKKIEKDYDNNGPIYDDCNEIRKKIKAFLGKGLMKHSQFFKILGENLQHNSFNKFMSFGPERLSGASNKTYRLAYHFFEKLRLSEGKTKTKKRLKNEAEFPDGFPLRHDDGRRFVFVGFNTK